MSAAPVRFGWSANGRKRQRSAPSTVRTELQESMEAEEERQRDAHDAWMRRQSQTLLCLEDVASLSLRKQDEGCVLAEAQKYREALSRWQQAIELTPSRAVLYELKAQGFLELGEIFDAVRAAEQATRCDPSWAEGYVTLGRAQLNFGEIEMGSQSLKKALELSPGLDLSDDLQWAADLLAKKDKVLQEEICNGSVSGPPLHSAKPCLRMCVGNKVCLSTPILNPGATSLCPGDLAFTAKLPRPAV